MPLQVNDPNVPSPYGEPMNPFAMVSKDDEDEVTAAPGVKPMEEGVSGAPGRPMAGARMMTRADMDEYIKIHIQHAQAYKNLDFDGGMFDFCRQLQYRQVPESHHQLAHRRIWRQFSGEPDAISREKSSRHCERPWVRNICWWSTPPTSAAIWAWILDRGGGISPWLIDSYIDLLQVRGQDPDHERVTVCESAELSKGLKARGVKKRPLQLPPIIRIWIPSTTSSPPVLRIRWLPVNPVHPATQHLGEILRDGNGEDLNPCSSNATPAAVPPPPATG